MQDYRSDVFYVSEACTDPSHAFCRVWTPCTWNGPLAPGKPLSQAEQLCNLKLSNWKEIPLLPPEEPETLYVRMPPLSSRNGTMHVTRRGKAKPKV